MMSDLRNISAQQEIFYSDPANSYTYATSVAALELLGFAASDGVTVTMGPATQTGWSASAVHAAITDGRTCDVFFGDAVSLGVAEVAGVVKCDETVTAP
jgi:hypothetical protein